VTPAETAAPVSAAPRPPPPAAISSGWRAALAAWMQRHKRYPEAARWRGEEGRVLIRFTAEPDGMVRDVALVQGSGSVSLDESTVLLLRGARIPPFPAEMTGSAVTVTMPVSYELER
jgi:protein TonB